MTLRCLLTCIAVLMSSTVTGQSRTPSTNVPIEKVVLFTSGVGYYEHMGAVNGEAETELRFRANQMNDVLKSLLLQDLDGGRVNTVVYPSQNPIEKILGSFDIDLSNNPTLGNLLLQMRGAPISVRSRNDIKQGVILSVESVRSHINGSVVDTDVVSLLNKGRVFSIPLSQIDQLELEDPALQEEFEKALTAVAQARDQDKKPLQIQFAGSGKRTVRIGYVVEAPVWKTSYRLILPEIGQDKGYLQGWAIVENQTENDWEDVQLTLISGRPISFIQNLYDPLYVRRPVIQPELHENLMPQLYDEGMELEESVAESDMMNVPAPPRSAMKQSARFGAAPAASAPMDPTVGIEAQVASGDVGELFQYVIGDVSLPRQRSAMIPIVTQEIGMQRVSIFNQSVQPRHPLNGVRLENTTSLHLMQGPATVLDAGMYAGDARLNEFSDGSFQLLSYALDFDVTVDVASLPAPAGIQTARIQNGVMEMQRKYATAARYTLSNKSKRARSIIIEHPRQHGWDLTDTIKPLETTDSHHRFLVDVDADSSLTVDVREERIASESVHLARADISTLISFSQGSALPQKLKQALTRAIELQRAQNQTRASMQQKEQRLNGISQEQSRIRENMGSVERNSNYYRRLLEKLEAQEDEIERIQLEIKNHQQEFEKQQKALNDYLSNLSIQ